MDVVAKFCGRKGKLPFQKQKWW